MVKKCTASSIQMLNNSTMSKFMLATLGVTHALGTSKNLKLQISYKGNIKERDNANIK